MKIYFCGSIKGGRERITTYSAMVKTLKEYAQVLTEHVSDIGYTAKGYSDAARVFAQDTTWLNDCDVVVAEISTPSLGVGYELAYAESKGIRTICFYEQTNADKVSSMIMGNPYFEFHSYVDQKDLIKQIKEIFEPSTK